MYTKSYGGNDVKVPERYDGNYISNEIHTRNTILTGTQERVIYIFSEFHLSLCNTQSSENLVTLGPTDRNFW